MNSFTFFCLPEAPSLELLARRLSIIPHQTVDIEVDESSRSVTCRTEKGTLKLTLMTFVERGDPFARLVWKTCVYFESDKMIDSEPRQRISSHIRNTKTVIGVVADPSLKAIDNAEAVLLFIANELQAMIVNGQDMLDALGARIG
jgi:hypothetical protein